MEGEALADDGPPAASPKSYLVLLFVAARAEEPLLEDELGLAQVLLRVDPLDLVLVVDLVALDPLARADETVHGVGQAVLARGGHALEDREQAVRLADVGADVQLRDRLLVGRGVGGLDDVADQSLAIAPDPAIRERPIHDRRQQRQVGAFELVAVEEAADRGRSEERRIAVEDQQVAVEAGELGSDLQHGVAGPRGLVLYDIREAVAQVAANRVLRATDHYVDVFRGDDLQDVADDQVDDRLVAQPGQEKRAELGIVMSGGEDDGLALAPGRGGRRRVALWLGRWRRRSRHVVLVTFWM